MKRGAPGAPLPLRLASTFFLVGEAAPFAPASFACLALLPFLYPYVGAPVWIQAALTLGLLWISIPVCTRAERHYGEDGGAITLDEVVGMLVTFLMIPAGNTVREQWIVLGIGFVLFRIFDVLKPYPANKAQDLPGGKGVVLDDVWAGVYANLVLRGILMVMAR